MCGCREPATVACWRVCMCPAFESPPDPPSPPPPPPPPSPSPAPHQRKQGHRQGRRLQLLPYLPHLSHCPLLHLHHHLLLLLLHSCHRRPWQCRKRTGGGRQDVLFCHRKLYVHVLLALRIRCLQRWVSCRLVSSSVVEQRHDKHELVHSHPHTHTQAHARTHTQARAHAHTHLSLSSAASEEEPERDVPQG